MTTLGYQSTSDHRQHRADLRPEPNSSGRETTNHTALMSFPLRCTGRRSCCGTVVCVVRFALWSGELPLVLVEKVVPRAGGFPGFDQRQVAAFVIWKESSTRAG